MGVDNGEDNSRQTETDEEHVIHSFFERSKKNRHNSKAYTIIEHWKRYPPKQRGVQKMIAHAHGVTQTYVSQVLKRYRQEEEAKR